MKNIFILTQTLEAGGAEKQVVLLANSLSKKYKVYIVVYFGTRINQKLITKLESGVITIIKLSGLSLKKIFLLWKLLKANHCSILFSYLLRPNLISGIIAKVCLKIIAVGGIRNSFLVRRKLIFYRIVHNYLTDFTIFNSYSGRQKCVLDNFKKHKSIVIPNAINIDRLITIRPEKKRLKILSVGRFVKQKDYLTALKAIRLVCNFNFKIKYLIIGWGNLKDQIIKWINEFSLKNYAEVIDNPENLDKYYFNSDIFLQTSIFEGLSNTIMEAMVFSLPIVTTNVGDNLRLVSHNKNGYIAKPKDFEEIAKYLLELLESYTLRIQMGQASYNIVKENYSIEKFSQNYFNFIDSVSNIV